jgi:hypothetical protein
MTKLEESLTEKLTIAQEQTTALAGMHDHLETRVETLEGLLFALQALIEQMQSKESIEECPVPSAEAVDVADVGSDASAIAALMGAATVAAQGDDALPDGMISR